MTEISNSNNKIKDFYISLVFGLIIGIASITPGLSGGIIAIALGVYEPLLESVVNIKANFKKSFYFLLPLFIGAVIGVIIFGIIMKPLLKNYETSIIYLFMGLVIGSIPSFLKKANERGFRILYLLPLLISFAIGMILAGAVDTNIKNSDINTVILLISGGILSLGMIVPGISSSFILLQMGVYEKIISAFLSFDFYFIFWVIIGFIIMSLLTIKFINSSFKKYHGFSYFAALGFLISSIVAVFPGIRGGFLSIIDFILFIIGLISVYIFMKKTNTK